MEQYKLRKCVPLKIFAHVIMAISTAGFTCCIILFLMSITVRGGKMADAIVQNTNANEYFSSTMFLEEYGKQLDSMYNGLEMISNGGNNGYPLDIYVSAEKNFKYAVYDREGKLLYSSPGWSDDAFRNTADKYYYTVDLCGLYMFESNIIRQTFFRQEFGAVDGSDVQETIFNTDEEMAAVETQEDEASDSDAAEVSDSDAAETSDSDASEKAGIVEGELVYGSNFTKYTYFYEFDESRLAQNVGYVCTYVPVQLVKGDAFYEDFINYNRWGSWGKGTLVSASMAFLLMIVCLVYLIVSAGYTQKAETIYLYMFDRLYTEVSAALILLVVSIFLSIAIEGIEQSSPFKIYRTESVIYIAALIISSYVVGIAGVLSFARRAKAGLLIKNALVYKICHGMYDVVYNGFINNHLLRKYIAVVFGFGIADFILLYTIFRMDNAFWTILVFIVYMYEFFYVGQKLLAVQKIKDGAQKIAAGDLSYKIDTENMSGVFKEFAEDINNIGNGLNAAVDESIKSERMKADLITNVSHDIKTPLTSIINYVDLLKRENIQTEPLREYIEVLDMKSQRLKALTEDLVEASRASSGNINLEKNNINMVELVSQAMGNYQDKFESKGLVPVINTTLGKMIIYADGERLYRVLDNLFNNAFKYAMTNSRIYIDMYVQNNKAYFVMKNISNAPLNISPEELTQRFVRGDASRATEGSGLGLSIARSLTELHGGTFDIYLDGDLFKVTLSFEISR